MDFVNENLDKLWDWYYLSINKNITMDFVIQNSDKLWGWHVIQI